MTACLIEGSDEILSGYAYFAKAPNAAEMHAENIRLLRALHMKDNLRANKAMAAWGVEARVPFLDKHFLDFAMTQINPADKMCGRAANGRIEKWVLRQAFHGYLPGEILFRKKEQFRSDNAAPASLKKKTEGKIDTDVFGELFCFLCLIQ